MVGIGVLGILMSLAAIIVGQGLIDQVEGSVDDSLELTNEALQSVSDSIVLTTTIVDTIQDGVVNVRQRCPASRRRSIRPPWSCGTATTSSEARFPTPSNR